jgi:O-antigen ligase
VFQVLELVGAALIGVVPILILLNIKSEMRNHYLLVSIFTNQLFLIFFIDYKVDGVYDGGSIFNNLIVLYVSAAPLLVILISRPSKVKFAENQKKEISRDTLKFSWIIIYLLGVITSASVATKLMPISSAVIFGVILYLIISGDFNFEKILIAVYRVFALISAGLTLSFIFGFDWSSLVIQRIDPLNLDRQVYFSPLGSLFGFPPRSYGPFGSGQVSGLFSTFGIACFAASSNKKKNFASLFSLIAFGSCSGSRTFYFTTIVVLSFSIFKKFAPRKNAAFWIVLPISGLILGLLIYKLFLPLISNSDATLSNFTGRSEIWRLIATDWSKDGLLGHGPNTLREYGLNQLYASYAHAHNSFLQALWDFGLLGLVALVTMIISVCVQSSKNFFQRGQVLTLVVMLLCIQTEPTLVVALDVTCWFWLVPLIFVFSRERQY